MIEAVQRYYIGYKKRRNKMGGMRELLILALPIIASQSCDTLMVFTDRLFVSKLSADHMNAAVGGGIASFLLMTFFMGLIGFSTALTAQYYGAKKYNLCPQVTVQSGILSIIAYPIILTMLPLLFLYFDSSHLSVKQVQLQKEYVSILVYGSIISLLRHSLSCFFSGIGKTRIVMVASVVILICNVVFNYILIFGHLGLPALGIAGAAYGTIASGFVGVVILLYSFLKHDKKDMFHITKAFTFNAQILKKILRYGSPAGTEFFVNFIAFSTLIFLFHSYNQETATATSIMFNWDMVTFVPLVGIEIAITSLVGRYIGAGKTYVAERAAYTGVRLGWIFSAIVIVAFLTIPSTLVKVFEPEVFDPTFAASMDLAVTMLRIATVYILAHSVLLSFIGALRGAGDTVWTMWVSMGLHWTFVPVIYLCLYVFDIGTIWSWFTLALMFLGFCLVFYFRFKSGNWKSIQVIEQEY